VKGITNAMLFGLQTSNKQSNELIRNVANNELLLLLDFGVASSRTGVNRFSSENINFANIQRGFDQTLVTIPSSISQVLFSRNINNNSAFVCAQFVEFHLPTNFALKSNK
jgi:hypothetical protein